MSGRGPRMRDLPSALRGAEAFNDRLAGRHPAVFLDYDGIERPVVKALVERLLAEDPDELRVTPGKMVCEIQPKLDWDKGKAVLRLLAALDLDREDTVALYVGDDITDEDAFAALKGRGVGVFVGECGDPELAGRRTAADFVLISVQEVERFLRMLARSAS